jgi:hypothetical protein
VFPRIGGPIDTAWSRSTASGVVRVQRPQRIGDDVVGVVQVHPLRRLAGGGTADQSRMTSPETTCINAGQEIAM